MAWSWSHSNEAYANAEENVQNKDREWLETVFAEWHACKIKNPTNPDAVNFTPALNPDNAMR